MKKDKLNLPIIIGSLLFAALSIADRFIEIPFVPDMILRGISLALVIWGIIIIARSPEMKNSKLRKWKLRMIGREK